MERKRPGLLRTLTCVKEMWSCGKNAWFLGFGGGEWHGLLKPTFVIGSKPDGFVCQIG